MTTLSVQVNDGITGKEETRQYRNTAMAWDDVRGSMREAIEQYDQYVDTTSWNADWSKLIKQDKTPEALAIFNAKMDGYVSISLTEKLE